MTARTYALGIEYCGTTFNGWQVQPDRPSVQAALEAVIHMLCDTLRFSAAPITRS